MLILFLTLIVPHVANAADTLFKREVNQSEPGEKTLRMSFEELRRDEKVSLIKVTYGSGASVPIVMFLSRCYYDLAHARNAQYYVILMEWNADDNTTIAVVGFTDDSNVDVKTYFDESGRANKKLERVSDSDLLFKPKP
ncbi:MAG TPA: hypothetical protein VM260_10935 [Pirellula sp.]|nr:hypothetical protein [Pirellula sp.]